MLDRVKFYIRGLRGMHKYLVGRKGELPGLNYIAGELLRNTHSIEKGLSISRPRLGFGHNKQDEMMEQIRILYKSESSYHREVCVMALNAINEYLLYHKSKLYEDDFCNKLNCFLEDYAEVLEEKIGGTVVFEKKDICFKIPEIENFFLTRHSIRNFDDKNIDVAKLKKALYLAQRAPSACNRQGVRTYVLSENTSKMFAKELEGVGGFAEDVKQYILVTGKTSSYRIEEQEQYIVSASMYAAYLTLTLHLYGLGACVIQRSVIWSNSWEKTRKKLGIESDEQIICLLAVGNLKESCVVPLSHRMKNEEMIRFL